MSLSVYSHLMKDEQKGVQQVLTQDVNIHDANERTDDGEFNSSPSSLREAGNKNRHHYNIG